MKTILVPSLVALAFAAGSVHAAAPEKSADKAGYDKKKTAAQVETRDWAKVDTNKDGLISPEEMEAFLAASQAADKAKVASK